VFRAMFLLSLFTVCVCRAVLNDTLLLLFYKARLKAGIEDCVNCHFFSLA